MDDVISHVESRSRRIVSLFLRFLHSTMVMGGFSPRRLVEWRAQALAGWLNQRRLSYARNVLVVEPEGAKERHRESERERERESVCVCVCACVPSRTGPAPRLGYISG